MNLTPEAVSQIEAEVKLSIEESGDITTKNVDGILANENLILEFLQTLVAFIPGIFGKIAGQAVLIAAKAWFSNKKKA